jgi:DNA polymerase-3 subunit delta'
MADKLHHAAAPKLLKTLEEPPEKTLFILISEKQEVMLPTILSRTQIIKIPRYPDADVIQFLTSTKSVDLPRARQICMLADGSLIAANDLLLRTDEAEWIFTNFRQWMRYCFSMDIASMLTFVSEVSKIGRERQKTFLLYALRITQFSLYMNLDREDLLKSEGEEMAFLSKFFRYMPTANIQSFVKEFQDAHYHIERNGNASVIFTDLSLNLVRLLAASRQIATN